MHGAMSSTLPLGWQWGGPQMEGREVPSVPDLRNLFAPASCLGLVMLGMAQRNKVWFLFDEEKK